MHLSANASVQDITGELESRGFLKERRHSKLPSLTYTASGQCYKDYTLHAEDFATSII